MDVPQLRSTVIKDKGDPKYESITLQIYQEPNATSLPYHATVQVIPPASFQLKINVKTAVASLLIN